MTRATFATVTQAERARKALEKAREEVAGGGTLAHAVEENHLSYGPTSSTSTLQRWLKKPKPVIAKTCSGYYLKVAPATNTALLPDEEAALVEQVLDKCREDGSITLKALTLIADQFRIKHTEESDPTVRRRLARCQFGRSWGKGFVKRHEDKLSWRRARGPRGKPYRPIHLEIFVRTMPEPS